MRFGILSAASLLRQMLKALTEHRAHMSVGERIEYRLSIAAAAYQLIAAQYRKLMRNGG